MKGAKRPMAGRVQSGIVVIRGWTLIAAAPRRMISRGVVVGAQGIFQAWP